MASQQPPLVKYLPLGASSSPGLRLEGGDSESSLEDCVLQSSQPVILSGKLANQSSVLSNGDSHVAQNTSITQLKPKPNSSDFLGNQFWVSLQKKLKTVKERLLKQSVGHIHAKKL